MGVPPMSTMAILAMSATGVSPVEVRVFGRAGTALRLTGRMPVLRQMCSTDASKDTRKDGNQGAK
jgi:hypothetical protein